MPEVLFVDEFGKDHTFEILFHDVNPFFGQIVRIIDNFCGPSLVEDSLELLKTLDDSHQD
jgi:hypothetical protein